MPNTDPNSLAYNNYTQPDRWFKSGTTIQGVGEDPEYDDAIMLSDVIDQPQMLERYRGQQQSGWQQLGRAIERGVKSAPLTALENAAYLFDPNTWISLFTGEAVEDNAIAEWARSIKGEIADDNKIYSETGVHDLSDPATRFEMLSSAIDSGLAFAATGYGVGAAFKGAATALKATKMIKGYASAMKAVDTSAHLLAGTAQNIAEGKMAAIEGYNEGKGQIDIQANDLRTKLFKDKLSSIKLPETELKVDSESGVATEVLKGTNIPLEIWQAQQNEAIRGEVENEVGMFVKDSKNRLATEMAKGQRWNLMNVATDAFALRGIMKTANNTITRTERIKKVADKAKESFTTAKGLANTGKDIVGQGVEEVGQEILKKELVANALDPETQKNTSFFARLNDYTQDSGVKQAFVAGALGGPVQSGLTTMASTIGEVWNKKAINEHNKNVETQQAAARELNNSYLNANMKSTADLLAQKEEAIARGDEESAFVADRKLFGNLVYNNAVRGTVNTLEEDLNDLAYGKTDEATEAERVKAYGEDYKTRAKDWLNQLAVHEKEFIKAHNASIGKEGLDQNKRALLYTLATRIEDTRSASKEITDKVNRIEGKTDAKDLALLEAQKARLESILKTNKTPSKSVNPLEELNQSLQESIEIMQGTRRANERTPDAPQTIKYKKAQAKLREVDAKINELKPNVTGTLEAKDLEEITKYGESLAENELLNEHYNSMYVDIKNDKEDLTDAQQKTIEAIRNAHVDYGSAVNTILENTVPQRPPSNATTVDNTALDQELSVLENEEQRNQVLQDVDRLATAYVENDQETINSPELEYVGEQFTNNLKASIKAKEEEARQKAKLEEFEKRKEATKSALFSSLENTSEIDEQGIAEYEKLSENRNNVAGLSELVGELNSIHNELLSGATIPDNVNRDVALGTIERILKSLKADVENNTNVTYGEVDHYQDHLDSDTEETNQNDEFGNERKLRAVNAMAYNGTDIEESMLDFVNYVNDPDNNLVGREVLYELPVLEDMPNMTESEAIALQMVINSKGKALSKSDLAFIQSNLPIRTTIQNTGDKKISAWLHSTSYEGYSPTIRSEVNKFNMNQRVQIITNLLAGKKVYTTIKTQRGGYGNRQFWYTRGKDRVIVNTQDAEAMNQFNEAVNSKGSKAKRTPVHNRIGDAVDTIEFKVADSKGEIEGKHTGKKANNIYFKTLAANGEERYVRAYVRSANDSKSLLNDVMNSMTVAIENHRTELEAVAKFLNKPLESLTDADVVSTLFNNAEAILLNRGNAESVIANARMRVDYTQLSNPAYIELLTQGANPIVYTNMAKFSNNGSKPSLYVQGTVEMDTAYHFKKDVPVTNITPVVDNTVKQAEVEAVLDLISDPTIRSEMRVALLKASKKDLQVLAMSLNRQSNSTPETLDVLRTLNKLFNTGITNDILNSEAIVSLWNEYRTGQMSADTQATINKLYGKGVLKAFDKFVTLQDVTGISEEISELPTNVIEDSVQHDMNVSSFSREQRTQILSLLEPFIVGNSTYNEVVSAYARASEFSGNVTESTAILNELRTKGSELQKEASLYIDSRLNTNKQYPHLSEINSNNSPSVVDETLREAFSKVTNNKGDNANEYLQDALSQSLQDSGYTDLANKVKALSKESFSALQNHYVTTNEDITESIPETISELDLPITERQSTTINEDRVIFNNRDNIAKQIGRGSSQVVYDTKGEVYEEEILNAFNAVAINDFGDLMYKQYLIDLAYNYGYTELGDALTDQSFGVLNSLASSSAKTAMTLITQLGVAHAVSENIQTILRAYNATGFYATDVKALLPTTNKRYDSKQKSLGNEVWYIPDHNGTDIKGNITFAPLITNNKGEILSLQGTRKSKNGLVGIYAVSDTESANAANELVEQDATVVYSNSDKFVQALSERLKSNTPEVSDTEQSEVSNHFDNTVDVQVADIIDIEGIRYRITLENNKLYATAEGKAKQPIPPRVHKALITKLEEDYKKHCK